MILVFLLSRARVTGQLEHLGGEIFHNGGQVTGRAPAPTRCMDYPAQQPYEYGRRGIEDRLDSNATSPFLHFTTFPRPDIVRERSNDNNDTE
ncbi:hypothetical protein EVAR_66789_1 [Eumeta japonica]|uniref:Uncharacterized protein n=1 Tax=Eumeta variegata TaxID=151549 RepID=A0A4C1ZZS1_EUMVA|nr:hypothetical protein EVAR_66789_1 [Eumeta japonica]